VPPGVLCSGVGLGRELLASNFGRGPPTSLKAGCWVRPCAEGKALLRATDRRHGFLEIHHKEVFQEEKPGDGGRNHRNRAPGSGILSLDGSRSGPQNDQSPLSRASIGTVAWQGTDRLQRDNGSSQWKNCTRARLPARKTTAHSVAFRRVAQLFQIRKRGIHHPDSAP
jgi:hypothetical protein